MICWEIWSMLGDRWKQRKRSRLLMGLIQLYEIERSHTSCGFSTRLEREKESMPPISPAFRCADRLVTFLPQLEQLNPHHFMGATKNKGKGAGNLLRPTWFNKFRTRNRAWGFSRKWEEWNASPKSWPALQQWHSRESRRL